MPRSRRHDKEDSDRHRRRGHGRHGGRERFFRQGELRLVMLYFLKRQPGSGYDIIRALETCTGGRYTPSPGVVYPTLTLLQDLDHIVLDGSAGSRNTYRVTAAGTAYLTAYASTLEQLVARMAEARSNQDTVIPDEVGSATAALMTAIRANLRASNGSSVAWLTDMLIELVGRIDDSKGE